MDAWTVANVEQWLNARGFPQFVETFKENDVNGIALTELNEESLLELEVPEDLHSDFILKRDTDLNLSADQIVTVPSRRKKKKRRQFKQVEETGDGENTQEKPKEGQDAEHGHPPADSSGEPSTAAAREQPRDEASSQNAGAEAQPEDNSMARPSRRRQRFKTAESNKSQEPEAEAGEKQSQQKTQVEHEAQTTEKEQQKRKKEAASDAGKKWAESKPAQQAQTKLDKGGAHSNKQGKTPPARPAPPPARPPPPPAAARAHAAIATPTNHNAGSHADKSGGKGIGGSDTTAGASKREAGVVRPARPAAPTSAATLSTAKHRDGPPFSSSPAPAPAPASTSSSSSSSSLSAQQQRKNGSRPEITVVGAKPITADFKKVALESQSASAPTQKNPSSGGRPEITVVSARPMDKSAFRSPPGGGKSSDDRDDDYHDDGDDDLESGEGDHADAAPKTPPRPTRLPLADSRRLEILQRVKNGEISQEEAAEIIEKEERELAERQGGPTLQAEEKQSTLTRLRKLGKASATGLSKFAQRVGRATQKTYLETFGNVDLPSIVVETSVVRDHKKDFGFLISAGGAPPVINSITYGGMCPDVQLGDVVEVINDIECHFMSGLKARELLNQTPHGFKANLRLRRRGPDDHEPAVQQKKQQQQTEGQRPQPTPRARSSEKATAGQSPSTKSSSSSLPSSEPNTRESGANETPEPKPRPQPKPAPAKPPTQHQQQKPKAPPRRRSFTSSTDKKTRPVPAPRKPRSGSTSP